MITIYKYWLPIQDEVQIEMPVGAAILSVQTGNVTPIGERPVIWALVDTEAKTFMRRFRVFGTGHGAEDIKRNRLVYIGTVQMERGKLVWHIFAYPTGSV